MVTVSAFPDTEGRSPPQRAIEQEITESQFNDKVTRLGPVPGEVDVRSTETPGVRVTEGRETGSTVSLTSVRGGRRVEAGILMRRSDR